MKTNGLKIKNRKKKHRNKKGFSKFIYGLSYATLKLETF